MRNRHDGARMLDAGPEICDTNGLYELKFELVLDLDSIGQPNPDALGQVTALFRDAVSAADTAALQHVYTRIEQLSQHPEFDVCLVIAHISC